MTREYLAFAASFQAAERSGDAAAALEYHRGIPMFRGSCHQVLLTQLADLADVMTPWLWARWAVYQCTRAEDPGTDSGITYRAALDYVLRMFHADRMQQIWDDREDPMSLIAQTMGEDWALHQICTFEMGGLDVFLDDLATGRLADECGLARQWLDATMSGYRVAEWTPLRLRVRDLATDEVIDLLDLGAHVHAEGEGWLIGRLVPSGTTPPLMFDTRPLAVDEQTAREVAATAGRRGGWIAALEAAVIDGRFDPDHLRSEDRELATDVPGLKLLAAGTSRSALAGAMDALRRGRDEVGRTAFRILRAAAEGSLDDEMAPYVGAAVVNPHGFAEARRQLADTGVSFERWAGLVVDPARTRLLKLAQASEAAA